MRVDRSSGRRPVVAPRRRVRTDDGAAAVELALVMPVLLLVLFGIIDFGRALNQQLTLTEAAREGARVGAINGTVAQVQAKVDSVAGVPVTYPGTPTVCSTTSTANDSSTVVVRYTYVPITPLGSIAQLIGGTAGGSIVLDARGVMTCVG